MKSEVKKKIRNSIIYILVIRNSEKRGINSQTQTNPTHKSDRFPHTIAAVIVFQIIEPARQVCAFLRIFLMKMSSYAIRSTRRHRRLIHTHPMHAVTCELFFHY